MQTEQIAQKIYQYSPELLIERPNKAHFKDEIAFIQLDVIEYYKYGYPLEEFYIKGHPLPDFFVWDTKKVQELPIDALEELSRILKRNFWLNHFARSTPNIRALQMTFGYNFREAKSAHFTLLYILYYKLIQSFEKNTAQPLCEPMFCFSKDDIDFFKNDFQQPR